MREIAAASDFDFVAAEPRPARAAAKRGRGRKKPAGAIFARLAKIWRYSTPFFAVASLLGLLAAIAVNAMYMQHGKHPAPLFGSTVKVDPPRPTPRPGHLELLLSDKLPSRTAGPVAAQPGALSAPPVVANLEPEAPVAAPKKSHDAIGAMIAGKSPAPEAAAPSKALISAQRALHKLGAPVTADGVLGATTRKALEAFQRDNHLPVTGELNAKTRKALAARSGLPVE